MRADNYLPHDRYYGYSIETNGFSIFQDPENNQYYFAYFDEDDLIFRSEGYGTIAGRDNGIASVQKNMINEEQHTVKMLPDGKWILSLRAGNHQEIGRSCAVASEEAALALLPAARAKRKADALAVVTAAAAEVTTIKTSKQDDDYLACNMYIGHQRYATDPDFSTFSHDGEFYFAMLNNKNEVVLRSEGYKSESARNNGIASVTKNREDKDQYSVEQKLSYHFVILKAKNHQEIGRSCPYKSAEDANNFIHPVIEAAPVKTPRQDDDYLACKLYKGHQRSTSNPDFSTFSHEGEFYFAMLDSNDDVVLRSEGYKSESARNNGIASVMKNREDKGQYSVEEKMSYHFVVLKAKNHQEIGRSCPYKSAEAAQNFIHPVAVVAPVAAMVAEPKSTLEPASIVDREDDYLACKNYEGHRVNDKQNNVALFKHENGLFYFALYDEHGRVRLRSEGFVDAKTRDEELSGVIKFKDDDSMYSKIEKGSYYLDVLKDKTGREVGRSCLKKVAAAAVVPSGPPDREDDYLPCKAYKGHEVNDKKNNVAFFRNDGLFYFVLYDTKGEVRLRSEGFPNAKQRDEELSGVLKHKDDKSLYSKIERSGHYMDVLKDKTGREVGRSCLKKEKVVAPVAPVSAVTAAAAAAAAAPLPLKKAVVTPAPVKKKVVAAAPVVAKSGGFNWLWLLLPLLLLAAFLLFKTCSSTPPPAPVVTPEPVATPSPTPKPVTVATPITCDLQWILYDFDKYNIRPDASRELDELAALLNKHEGTTASLVAHTDARGSVEYNDNLSRNRAREAKQYLQQKGISALRIKTSARSEAVPYAKNTADDSGRKYNRRVELYLLDADGKEICDSKAPKISNALKVK